jgi:hypothetical protein
LFAPSLESCTQRAHEGTVPEDARERGNTRVVRLAFMAAPHRAMSMSPES